MSKTFRVDTDGTLLINDTPSVHRAGIMNQIAAFTFAIADEIGTLECFGLIEDESGLKAALRLLYVELEREFG